MNTLISSLLITGSIVFCQVNCFASLIEPRMSRKRTYLICNFFCLVCFTIHGSITMAFGPEVGSQIQLFTFMIPSIIFCFIISKYRDARFFFTYVVADISFMVVETVGWMIIESTVGEENSISVFIRMGYVMLTAFLIIKFFAGPYREALQFVNKRWRYPAICAVIFELLITYITSYPTIIKERPEDFLMVGVICVVLLCIMLDYVKIVLDLKKDSMELLNQEILNKELELSRLQINQSEKQYEVITDSIDRSRRFRHDMKHYVVAIKTMLADNRIDELKAYVNAMHNDLEEAAIKVYCQDYVANLLLSRYAELCEKENIKFTCDTNIPSRFIANELHLCALLGNALENACEACSRMEEGEEFVDIKASVSNGNLIIIIRNSFDGTIFQQGEKLGSCKREDHSIGIGLSSIQAIAEIYNGYCQHGIEGKVFNLFIALSKIEQIS